MPTAILIDGSFFLKRYRRLVELGSQDAPATVAEQLMSWALAHLNYHGDKRNLYRIFFYDAPPLQKRVHRPISQKSLDFSKTPEALFRLALFDELRKRRKLALRLGELADHGGWMLKQDIQKQLLHGEISRDQLLDEHFSYHVTQKGVDMRIGLDIAALAYKQQADQIILMAGDSDFVPAAKLARREGIDFILDPMWQPIPAALHEHIDGLRSTCPKRVPRPS
jgi:uncharacterized LabA/DUF88 family protein